MTRSRNRGESRDMGELDGRVIAIAGAAGGLGPSVVPAARRRGRDDRRDRRLAGAPRPARRRPRALRPALRRPRRRPARRARRRAAGRATCASASASVDGLLHLVGGWRGGEPLAECAAVRLRVAPRPPRPHRPAHHPRLLGRPAASEHGRFVLVLRPGAEPRRHQRLLRRRQGGRRELDARPRRLLQGHLGDRERHRRQRDPHPADARENPDKEFRTFTSPRRSPRRSASSAATPPRR